MTMKIAKSDSEEAPPAKRIRIRRCSSSLRLPVHADVTDADLHLEFKCELEQHGTDVQHRETGLAAMDDGTYRKFVMQWSDEGIASLRRLPKKLR